MILIVAKVDLLYVYTINIQIQILRLILFLLFLIRKVRASTYPA